MPVTRLVGPKGRIDLTLEGLTFVRPKSQASRRGTSRVHHVEWARIRGAELGRSRGGRPVVRISVDDAVPVEGHGDDPHALKVSRSLHDEARELVDRINEEVEVRRRWSRSQQAVGEDGA